MRPRPSTTTIPTPGTFMALNIVPGDEEAGAAEAGADGEEDEGAEEFDDPRADRDADLLLEELPHAASSMRAAPADAAMISARG